MKDKDLREVIRGIETRYQLFAMEMDYLWTQSEIDLTSTKIGQERRLLFVTITVNKLFKRPTVKCWFGAHSLDRFKNHEVIGRFALNDKQPKPGQSIADFIRLNSHPIPFVVELAP